MNKRIEELKEKIRELENSDNEKEFDERLDEEQEKIKIGCLIVRPSQVLKECDPIAYREGFANYISERIEELEEVCLLAYYMY